MDSAKLRKLPPHRYQPYQRPPKPWNRPEYNAAIHRGLYTQKIELDTSTTEPKSFAEQYTQIFNATVNKYHKQHFFKPTHVSKVRSRTSRHYIYRNIVKEVLIHYGRNPQIRHRTQFDRQQTMHGFDSSYRDSQEKAATYVRETIEKLRPMTIEEAKESQQGELRAALAAHLPSTSPTTPTSPQQDRSFLFPTSQYSGQHADSTIEDEDDFLERPETPEPPNQDYDDELPVNGTELSDLALGLLAKNHFEGSIEDASAFAINFELHFYDKVEVEQMIFDQKAISQTSSTGHPSRTRRGRIPR